MPKDLEVTQGMAFRRNAPIYNKPPVTAMVLSNGPDGTLESSLQTFEEPLEEYPLLARCKDGMGIDELNECVV